MKKLSSGSITWSYQHYRSNAKKEYTNFSKALFRELLQNSNDAGAKHIDFQVYPDKVICTDDGCGMDLDIIQNKLLVIGGSHKEGDTVGGLGKAKELLFFSWPEWVIRTKEYEVRGHGGEYEIFEANEIFNGTMVTLTAPDDELFSRSDVMYAHVVLSKSYTKAKTTLQSPIKEDVYASPMEIKPRLPLGRKIHTIKDLGTVHHLKSSGGEKLSSNMMAVLANGTWMHDRYIGDHQGIFTLNITRDVCPDIVKVFTASRDTLNADMGVEMDKFVERLTLDARTMVEAPTEPLFYVIKGSGPENDDAAPIINDPICAALRANEVMSASTDTGKIPYTAPTGYQQDFAIFIEDPRGKTGFIRRFMDTQRASVLAKIWAATLKQVLKDNKMDIPFRIGFVFGKQCEAMLADKGSNKYFLLNPQVAPPHGIQNKIPFIHWMRTTAVHEVTHLFEHYHDEDWALRYHQIESNTWKSHRIYSQIATIR